MRKQLIHCSLDPERSLALQQDHLLRVALIAQANARGKRIQVVFYAEDAPPREHLEGCRKVREA